MKQLQTKQVQHVVHVTLKLLTALKHFKSVWVSVRETNLYFLLPERRIPEAAEKSEVITPVMTSLLGWGSGTPRAPPEPHPAHRHMQRLQSATREEPGGNTVRPASLIITQTSASRGRELEALGAQADEASLRVGARSKRTDLRQLGALVDI